LRFQQKKGLNPNINIVIVTIYNMFLIFLLHK
jgi:hypothetical protein